MEEPSSVQIKVSKKDLNQELEELIKQLSVDHSSRVECVRDICRALRRIERELNHKLAQIEYDLRVIDFEIEGQELPTPTDLTIEAVAKL